MSERDLPEYVTPAELLEVVGDNLEALCWLRGQVPGNTPEAAEFYREHWPDVLRGFEELRQRFEEGECAALLAAVETAGACGVPMPEWVAEGFGRAWGRYTEAEAPTLGNAFGVERPEGWTQDAERKIGYVPLIHLRCRALKKAGLKTGRNAEADRTVFEQIAAELADPELLAKKGNPAPDPVMADLFRAGDLRPIHVTASWVKNKFYSKSAHRPCSED